MVLGKAKPYLVIGVLSVVVLAAGLFAVRTLRHAQERASITAIEKIGGRVVGFSWGGSVESIVIDKDDISDEDMRLLEAFPALRYLYLYGGHISDPGLSRIGKLADLRGLDLCCSRRSQTLGCHIFGS